MERENENNADSPPLLQEGKGEGGEKVSVSRTAREVFEPYYNEVKRREAAAEACKLDLGEEDGEGEESPFQFETTGDRYFKRVESEETDDPFVIPSQKWLVYTLSQEKFGPPPSDPSDPAICFYGLFEDLEDAREHAVLVKETHPSFSVLISPSHEWVIASRSQERSMDEKGNAEKTERLLKKERFLSSKNESDFRKCIREEKKKSEEAIKREEEKKKRTCGTDAALPSTPVEEEVSEEKTNARIEDLPSKGEDDSSKEHEEEDRPRQKIKSKCRVPEQRVIAASFVKGEEAGYPEFLFRVYACFETEERMERYVRNVCCCSVLDHDVNVLSTCEFVFPQSLRPENAKKEVFRSEELQKIVSHHKKSPAEVERFLNEVRQEE
jgi:hypothetical protein